MKQTGICLDGKLRFYVLRKKVMIDRYIEKFQITQSTDYAKTKSVKKHNRAMDACRKIASQIQSDFPNLKEEFSKLLNSDIPELSILVAHHMIEVMKYDDEHKAKALKIIYNKSKEDSVDGFGNKLWLNDYLKENPQDEKLIDL